MGRSDDGIAGEDAVETRGTSKHCWLSPVDTFAEFVSWGRAEVTRPQRATRTGESVVKEALNELSTVELLSTDSSSASVLPSRTFYEMSREGWGRRLGFSLGLIPLQSALINSTEFTPSVPICVCFSYSTTSRLDERLSPSRVSGKVVSSDETESRVIYNLAKFSPTRCSASITLQG